MNFAHALAHPFSRPSRPVPTERRIAERRSTPAAAIAAPLLDQVPHRADTPALIAFGAHLRRLAARADGGRGEPQPGGYALLSGGVPAMRRD